MNYDSFRRCFFHKEFHIGLKSKFSEDSLNKFVIFILYNADLTGAQDGSVRMFEWGHSQQITCFRSGGNSRVTRMRFNYQGNKVAYSI